MMESAMLAMEGVLITITVDSTTASTTALTMDSTVVSIMASEEALPITTTAFIMAPL